MIYIKTKLLKSWKFWLAIFSLVMVVFFFIMENQSNKMQPTEGWSISIDVLEEAPRDYRKMDIIRRPDGEGILISYLADEGIEIYELDWFGNTQRHLFIEEDVSNLRLLDLGFNENTYYIYLSDRVILEKYDLDINSFTQGEKVLVSESSEQFSAYGEAIIVGDNDITEIIYKGQVLETFTGYDDLKRVNILYEEDKIVASMDTLIGSDLLIIDGESSSTLRLITPVQENRLGYIQDIYLKEGIITVLSSKYHISEDFPTSFGMWQIDENLQIINEEFWHHNRTTLRPIITDVEGEDISYVLGVLTRRDENKEVVLEQPRLQNGAFTNILKFHSNKGDLVDYDRLSTTREYPLGYEYIKGEDGDVLVWADRVDDNSKIKLAGNGQQWISYGNQVHEIDYLNAGSEILMSFATSIVWGIIFAAIDLLDYLVPIFIFIVLLFIFIRRTDLEPDRRDLILFLIVAIFTIAFKFFTTAISNVNLQAYGHIYPYVLGNDLVLGAISIITSLSSLLITYLWYNKNKDLNGYVHTFFFVGLEVYFYIFSIMVFVVSAMSKSAVMI